MFEKFFKKGKRGKKIKLKKTDHVHHDWIIALLVFFAGILVVVGISAFIFLQTKDAEVVEDLAIEGNDLINQELLDETLLYFKEKEDKFLDHQITAPNAPSL